MSRIVIFLMLIIVEIFAQSNRYEVKSAVVEYKITGGGTIMGVESSLKGVGSLYFKNFGALEYSMEKSIQKVMGESEEAYNVSKIVDDKIYSVDFEDNIIYEQNLIMDEELLNIKNEKNLSSMGAKKTGKINILGYECDVWELGEEKISVYKTVPLKIEIASMGVLQVQEATSAKFDIEISDEKFKLPNFPIKKVDNMSLDEQSEVPELSPEQEKMMEDMMKQMGESPKEDR